MRCSGQAKSGLTHPPTGWVCIEYLNGCLCLWPCRPWVSSSCGPGHSGGGGSEILKQDVPLGQFTQFQKNFNFSSEPWPSTVANRRALCPPGYTHPLRFFLMVLGCIMAPTPRAFELPLARLERVKTRPIPLGFLWLVLDLQNRLTSAVTLWKSNSMKKAPCYVVCSSGANIHGPCKWLLDLGSNQGPTD